MMPLMLMLIKANHTTAFVARRMAPTRMPRSAQKPNVRPGGSLDQRSGMRRASHDRRQTGRNDRHDEVHDESGDAGASGERRKEIAARAEEPEQEQDPDGREGEEREFDDLAAVARSRRHRQLTSVGV
jgi:hypothetical protein